jgi:tetratricopeptide (TPR) repeat protein
MLTAPQALQQAAAAYSSGDWAKAEQLCRWILAAHKDHYAALHLLGIIAARMRHTEEAAVLLERAVAAKPDDAAVHNNYGNVLSDLGRVDEALHSFARALSINPRDAQAHYNQGNALTALGRFDNALASYDRALELKPDNADALNNRGNALRDWVGASNPAGRSLPPIGRHGRRERIRVGYYCAEFHSHARNCRALRRGD